jgi:hypothetical protein
MNSGFCTIILYGYKVIVSVLGNALQSKEAQTSILLVCTLAMFILSYNGYYINKYSRIFWNAFYSLFMWSALLMYLVPNFPWLENGQLDDWRPLFSDVWLYSTLFVIFFTFTFESYTDWHHFFDYHKVNDESMLYNLVSQVTTMLLQIRKS